MKTGRSLLLASGTDRHLPIRFLFVLLLALCTRVVVAEVYTWTDEQGNVHFGDRVPQNLQATPVEIRATNTFKSVSVDTLGEFSGGSEGVVMYSASWCGVCKKARRYFRKQGIPFSEYDIETSSKGRKDFKELNARGVPVILVGGKRMNGFSARRFDSLYGG